MRVIGSHVVTGLILSGVVLALPTAAPGRKAASSTQASGTATVRDVKVRGDVVSGVLVNNSHRVLHEVRLLIRHTWLWHNERHPGNDNPGRADYYTLSTDVAAGAEQSFTYTINPPLPQRSDGRFVTTVEVVGFIEVGF